MDALSSQAQWLIALASLVFVLLLAALILDTAPTQEEEAEPPGPIGEVRLV